MLNAIVASAAGAQPASASVQVVWQQARWAQLSGPGDLGDANDGVFVISGEVRNAGDRPVRSIKIEYDLLDDLHHVIVSEFSYNHGAEDLRRPDYENGQVGREALDLRPLAPGASDLFRMVFFRSDVPHFAHWRVRVSDVEYGD